MRSLPIFRAWVRTCRYRERRAATPTPTRLSLARTPSTGLCNIRRLCPRTTSAEGRNGRACAGPPEPMQLATVDEPADEPRAAGRGTDARDAERRRAAARADVLLADRRARLEPHRLLEGRARRPGADRRRRHPRH